MKIEQFVRTVANFMKYQNMYSSYIFILYIIYDSRYKNLITCLMVQKKKPTTSDAYQYQVKLFTYCTIQMLQKRYLQHDHKEYPQNNQP